MRTIHTNTNRQYYNILNRYDDEISKLETKVRAINHYLKDRDSLLYKLRNAKSKKDESNLKKQLAQLDSEYDKLSKRLIDSYRAEIRRKEAEKKKALDPLMTTRLEEKAVRLGTKGANKPLSPESMRRTRNAMRRTDSAIQAALKGFIKNTNRKKNLMNLKKKGGALKKTRKTKKLRKKSSKN